MLDSQLQKSHDPAMECCMGDPKCADDKRNVLQPFSSGPRACSVKNLAHAKVRLVLAKMGKSFDLELDPSSEN
jgi:cytochrome P450